MSSSEVHTLAHSGKHSYHRRSFAHDYHSPFIYHIILKKADHCEPFGCVEGSARIEPGKPGCARIVESALGTLIAKAIIHLPFAFPILKLHQFVVMPDHVHILIQVLEYSEWHLDLFIEALRSTIAAKYSRVRGENISDEDIFEIGYCDKPLYDDRSLAQIYDYIRQNPHRLAMRQQFPQFFTLARKVKIGEEELDAYGNLFLLRNPDKAAVKISRRFSEEEKKQKREEWISSASKGTILVSPFISEEEKAIRTDAEAVGAFIILLVHESFRELYKPSGHDFALCSEGRLLILSIGEPTKTKLTRTLCERMNSLANEVCRR